MAINITEAYNNALYNKSEEQKRLSTPSSLDDYFKKQVATKEAMEQLQRGGTVSPEIAKYVDVAALKKEIESAKSGEEKSSLASDIGGGRGLEDSVDIKGTLPKTDPIDSYTNCCKQAAIKAGLDAGEDKKLEEFASSISVSKDEVKSFFDKKAVNADSIKEPSNAPDLHNPLEKTDEKEPSPYAVTFTDDFSGKDVTVNLSPDNAFRLQERFGSLEKASDFVKSWYNDAAYNVGYLSQDLDKDGVIGKNEALNLNSMVDINKGENSYSSIAESISDPAKQTEFLEQFGYIDNINDFINHSISQDRNFDKSLSNAEILGEHKFAVAELAFSGEETDIFTFNSMLFERPVNDRENIAMFAQRASEDILDELLDNNDKKEQALV